MAKVTTMISEIGLTKSAICFRLQEKGEIGYTYHSNGQDHAITRKLKNKIFKDRELVTRLGWQNQTDFTKIGRGEFTVTEARILIAYFNL